MKEMTKEYTNGEVTVVWKPHLCIHSENCFHGLPRVFNPKRQPWIDPTASDSQTIVDQVAKCPSGALSTYMNSEEKPAEIQEVVPTRAEVIPKGALRVFGTITVKLKDGSEVTREKVTSFCRCGHSANKPFCDGSHRNVEFDTDE